MNIWTCNRSLLTFALIFALPSCSGGTLALPSFDFGLGGGEFRRNVALVSAEMMDGSVKLVPPDGFCIDKRVLQQDFAVMARCDSLGGRGGAQGAMLGMITVAIAAEEGDVVLSEFIDALVPNEAEELAEFEGESVSLIQLRGDVPVGADKVHWRGVTRTSGQLISLAAYAPQEGEFAQEDARDALLTLAERTQNASGALSAEPRAETQSSQVETGLPGLLRGLFNRKPSDE